ncbi:MAG TPA: bifunctional YncE family protein/alkaline phosphatase family protein [Chthonomonadaceae bacterium]|nr:bifunctional YncE family protein/alkaline phosphatase family protein [Chthonomonadaceae bacterium]
MKRKIGWLVGVALGVGAAGVIAQKALPVRMGKQPDGAFVVSTGRRIEPGAIAFDGRPTDLALHPSGVFVAVLNQKNVFLANAQGVLPDSEAPLEHGAGYRGAVWTPDGKRLYVSVSEGYIQEFTLDGQKLHVGSRLQIQPDADKDNPRPGGMCVTRDGARLFVAACDRNSVVEMDLATGRRVREYKVQNIPFEVRLSEDEQTLLVSNWGGRDVKDDDETAASGNTMILVDSHGAAASGTVSLIRRDSGETKQVEVGLHPTALLVKGQTVYVANAASDSLSVLDIPQAKVVKTLPLKWGHLNLFGSMPCALALRGDTLYICDGGDNAVAEVELSTGRVRGFRPAGYFPTAIALSADGKTAFVLNSKGNGSTRRTAKGMVGNAHDFQGTLSVLDLQADLNAATDRVARDNEWNRDRAALRPELAVYNGAIQHVLYIIKENRTYDEVLGDMKEGNGDAKLCDLGEAITPNAHALARQFTLFDNAYVTGTNSADGHAWSTQALANDYLEHFYTGYRTYPDDGDCAMSIASSGALWDAALKKGKSLRVYGEFCDDELAVFTPTVTNWMQVWKDRVNHTHHISKQVNTRVASLRPYLHPNFVYWPLLQSDQERADLFIGEYQRLSREDKVPSLMIMALPCDHTEGRDPNYPKPQCMVADNDLALGRIVEAVSNSPQWKNTCIFVIEDDAQSGPDHVDGHRTVYMVLSPYVRRQYVDSSLYTTLSILASIERMLKLDPMNRFDALTPPIAGCFTDTPDLTPFHAVPNRTPLDQMNPPMAAQTGQERFWTEKSLALDWSGADRADPQILNEVLWHTLHGVDTPYPTQ